MTALDAFLSEIRERQAEAWRWRVPSTVDADGVTKLLAMVECAREALLAIRKAKGAVLSGQSPFGYDAPAGAVIDRTLARMNEIAEGKL